MNFAISTVPLSNGEVSNTPSGPFQNTVLDLLISFFINFTVFLPISRIIFCSSILSISDSLVSALFEILSAVTASIGKTNLQLFFDEKSNISPIK